MAVTVNPYSSANFGVPTVTGHEIMPVFSVSVESIPSEEVGNNAETQEIDDNQNGCALDYSRALKPSRSCHDGNPEL
jgi:hypothetical protein